MARGRALQFEKAFVKADSGCWNWLHATTSFGHGVYRGGQAHRYAYESYKGPIPEGMQVCHHCDNPLCVNPDHLFIGTQLDNMRDMTAKGRHCNQRKTHCPLGHEYTPENTRITNGSRFCRACNCIAAAKVRARKQVQL